MKTHMFLCSSCIKGLKFNDDQVKEVVHFGDIGDQKEYKCYVCSQIKVNTEGIYLSKEKVAEILEKVLDNMDSMHKKVKEGILTCSNCAKDHQTTEKTILCNCGNVINSKEEIKKFKLGMVKRLAYRTLISSIKKGGFL